LEADWVRTLGHHPQHVGECDAAHDGDERHHHKVCGPEKALAHDLLLVAVPWLRRAAQPYPLATRRCGRSSTGPEALCRRVQRPARRPRPTRSQAGAAPYIVARRQVLGSVRKRRAAYASGLQILNSNCISGLSFNAAEQVAEKRGLPSPRQEVSVHPFGPSVDKADGRPSLLWHAPKTRRCELNRSRSSRSLNNVQRHRRKAWVIIGRLSTAQGGWPCRTSRYALSPDVRHAGKRRINIAPSAWTVPMAGGRRPGTRPSAQTRLLICSAKPPGSVWTHRARKREWNGLSRSNSAGFNVPGTSYNTRLTRAACVPGVPPQKARA